MSRRKQSRPRHVDNDNDFSLQSDAVVGVGGVSTTAIAAAAVLDGDAVGSGGDVHEDAAADLMVDGGDVDGAGKPVPIKNNSLAPHDLHRIRNGDFDADGSDTTDNLTDGVRTNDPRSALDEREGSSPTDLRTDQPISSCAKCGIGFSDLSQYLNHMKQCGMRHKILMPYDPPAVNGYSAGRLNPFLDNDHHRSDLSNQRNHSFNSRDDEGMDYDRNMDDGDEEGDDNLYDEERLRDELEGDGLDPETALRASLHYRSLGKFLGGTNGDLDSSDEMRFRSLVKSDEGFLLNLRNRMAKSLYRATSGNKDTNIFNVDGLGMRPNRGNNEDSDNGNNDDDDKKKERRLGGGDENHAIRFGSKRRSADLVGDSNNADDDAKGEENNINHDRNEHDEDDDNMHDSDNGYDDDVNKEMLSAKRKKLMSEDKDGDRMGKDPAVKWALKAAERGLFGGHGNVTLAPLAATSAAVAQNTDSSMGRDPMPEEVNMYRSMLLQLQQQQLMQIQMIQQMRRQLVSSGINPSLLPADLDLSMMSSEGLASVSAAMSGLQNVTQAAKARGGAEGDHTSGSSTPSSSHDITTNNHHQRILESLKLSQYHPHHPRDSLSHLASSSSSSSYSMRKETTSSTSRPSTPGGDLARDHESLSSGRLLHHHQPEASIPGSLESKYLSFPIPDSAPTRDSPFPFSSSGPIKNPLEILQEKTAASLSSLHLPAGLKPDSSSSAPLAPSSSSSSSFPSSFSSLLLSSAESKPYTTTSTISASALFASSPSLSALHKETEALKPSPILPPLHLPLTPEDYKGYIQRGTILERSQYASDDPFFKHKCRFCHKVFGSDSALQIHVRSHTGERPFKCNICGNRFSTKGNLKVHFERHKAKYPHIKMDATPVPEHLDRHPNMMGGFSQPIPPSVPLPPPPMPRMAMPHPHPHHHHQPPLPSPSSLPPRVLTPSSSSSPSNHHPHPPPPPLYSRAPHHSPFPPNFGAPFIPGMSPFGLMSPSPRADAGFPFPHHLPMSLPASLSLHGTPGREGFFPPEFHMRPPISISSQETSVIKQTSNHNPRDIPPSPVDLHKSVKEEEPHNPPSQSPGQDIPQENENNDNENNNDDVENNNNFHDHENTVDDEDNDATIDNDDERDTPRPRTRESDQDENDKKHKENDIPSNETNRSRTPSPSRTRPKSRQSDDGELPTSSNNNHTSPRSPRSTSPTPVTPSSVISWASLATPQGQVLPSHPPALLPPHHPLPPGFPGLGLPYPGTPTSFPLPSPFHPVLPMSGPRVSNPSHFLTPAPPPPPPISSPPGGDGSVFRNSILPTKTIDPSENLEQYMEIEKSETSKLEQLVKNIEEKITDPNQCVICHRVLSCKSALQMHYRIHTGERPFKCKICGRSFTTKGNLKTHMGVHRAKPALRMMHQCPVCHKQFTNVLVLQQHIRSHTGSIHHMPHLSMMPSPMDWHHRPFGFNRHHPYLPPHHNMHPDSRSLDLTRRALFPHAPGFRDRSHSADGIHRFDSGDSIKEEIFRNSNNHDKNPERGTPSDSDLNSDKQSTPLPSSINTGRSSKSNNVDEESGSTAEIVDKIATSGYLGIGGEDEMSPKGNKRKHSDYENSFLPPSFGNAPFDAPLAALEERVKAFDSHISQTSFEKFRNSMGLGTAIFPSAGFQEDTDLDARSDAVSKSNSPSNKDNLEGYDPSEHDDLDKDDRLDNDYQCAICELFFPDKLTWRQHLISHKMKDLQDVAYNSMDNTDDEDDAYDRELEEDENVFPKDFLKRELEGDDGEDHVMDSERIELESYHKSGDNDQGDTTSPKETSEYNDNNNVSSYHDNNDESVVRGSSPALNDDTRSPPVTKSSTPGSNTDNLDARIADETKTSSLFSSGANNSSSRSPQQPSNDNNTPKSVDKKPPSQNANSSSPVNRQPTLKHQCMTCMKPFSSASALQIHTRTHTGDKPFKCTVCGKAFTTRGNLKVHMGTHMWNNSPSRRGRRMSIEPPFIMSHMKDNPFLPAGFPPRHPPDFFYQYPHPLMNGLGPKMNMNKMAGIPGMGPLGLPPLPHMPPHLLPDFAPKPESKPDHDAVFPQRTLSSSQPDADIRTSIHEANVKSRSMSPTPASAASGELDLSMKSTVTSVSQPASPQQPHSQPPVPSSSLSISMQQSPSASSASSSTPSPSHNKENSSNIALDLRNMSSAAPWLWGALPCPQCGQVFASQDAREHHIRTQHLGQSETSAPHHLGQPEAHPPKALLA